jgi:predicted MFS family arabinose efflux permease
MIPGVYRDLLRDAQARRLLSGLGVSALGDGMSMVSVGWLAVLIAPAGKTGVFVGLALAAYSLPGALGAAALSRLLRHRPARVLVLADSWLRAGCLGAIALLWAAGALVPCLYVTLLAGSSVLTAWGSAGESTMLSQLAGPRGRLAANSLYSAQASLAVIVGPALAGVLVAPLGMGSLLGVDAASFAFLGIAAWRTRLNSTAAGQPAGGGAAAESGFRQLRRLGLISLTALTWLFFFLYGPVEVALPVYAAHQVHAGAGLLGVYWASFGVGALVAALVTGTLRNRNIRRVTVAIVAGWGACLLPFGFAPVPVTLASFALGGLIYGPFIPLTNTLLQSDTPTASLPAVLAARGAIITIASPLGTAAGGPLVAALGPAGTLTASGAATVGLALATGLIWSRRKRPGRAGQHAPGIVPVASGVGVAEGAAVHNNSTNT